MWDIVLEGTEAGQSEWAPYTGPRGGVCRASPVRRAAPRPAPVLPVRTPGCCRLFCSHIHRLAGFFLPNRLIPLRSGAVIGPSLSGTLRVMGLSHHLVRGQRCLYNFCYAVLAVLAVSTGEWVAFRGFTSYAATTIFQRMVLKHFGICVLVYTHLIHTIHLYVHIYGHTHIHTHTPLWNKKLRSIFSASCWFIGVDRW